MLKFGVIEPSISAYVLPFVVLWKSYGSNRMCMDFESSTELLYQ